MTTKQERRLKLLDRIATYIYGSRWQVDLARDLDLNERTVRSWVGGRSQVSPETWRAVMKLLAKKINDGPAALMALEKYIATLVEED